VASQLLAGAGASAALAATPLGQNFRDEFYDYAQGDATYSVNVTNGNLVITSNEARTGAAGSDLWIRRSYNSLDAQSASTGLVRMGQGWRVSPDVTLRQETDTSLVYTDWTRAAWRFINQGGTWTPEDPMFGSLTNEGANRVVNEDETGHHLSFNSQGLLVADRDEQGNQATFNGSVRCSV
jgi:hypothetical protein